MKLRVVSTSGCRPGGMTVAWPWTHGSIMYTQQSNPAASYLGYDLFSGGGGGNMGSDLAHPNNPFWTMQLWNGMDRQAGSAIDNNMLRNWVFLLNSMQSANYPAYRPIAPWANFASWNAAPPIPA